MVDVKWKEAGAGGGVAIERICAGLSVIASADCAVCAVLRCFVLAAGYAGADAGGRNRQQATVKVRTVRGADVTQNGQSIFSVHITMGRPKRVSENGC